MLPIPYTPDEITPEWLTEALRAGGHLERACVTRVQQTTIGEGVGFMGSLTRLELAYDRPEPGAPGSLIAKLPTTFAQIRQLGNMFQYFEREVRFYRELAPHMPMRVPRAYYAEFDVAADRYGLLLEEVTDARVGDQLAGATLEQARIVVREAAKFHARFWEAPELEQVEWMPRLDHPMYDTLTSIYEAAWPVFLDYQQPDYPRAAITAVAERAIAATDRTRQRLNSCRQSIAHTDFRLDNMFFGDGGEFVLIDWQLSVKSLPLLDIGYFLSQSIDTALRREHERDLLRLYHDTLIAHGEKEYDFETCWDDYRLGVLVMFIIPVVAAANVDLSNPRALPLMRALAERSTAAILDLDCVRVLGD